MAAKWGKIIGGANKAAKEGAERVAKKKADQFTLPKEPRPPSLREEKDIGAAIEVAKKEPHLRPNKEGGFIGAPHSMKSMDDLMELRRSFDADVGMGAEGADWYERAKDWIQRVAGDDPQRQSQLARNLALFSAQSPPKSNLGFSIKAQNAAAMGMPLDKVRTGQQARAFNESFGYRPVAESEEQMKGFRKGEIKLPYAEKLEEAKKIPLGKKTENYANSMDRTAKTPTTGTNDIWHGRAWGYKDPGTNKPWSKAFSDTQHDFLDYETVLAVMRANEMKLNGRSDWTAAEIQAAPWVSGKGRGLAESKFHKKEKGVGTVQGPLSKEQLDEGIASASRTYPDDEKSFRANATFEETPGPDTGHLTALPRASEATRMEYFNDPRTLSSKPGERDLLYDKQKAYVAPTSATQGLFEGAPNPGGAAHPLVSTEGKAGERVVDKASRQMLEGTEAVRGGMSGQQMGAWSIPIEGSKVGQKAAYEIDLPPGYAMTADKLKQLSDTVPGVGDAFHVGNDNAYLTSFGKNGPVKQPKLFGAPGTRDATAAIQEAIPGAGVKSTGLDSGGTYFDWSKPGSDTVTKQILEKVEPSPMQMKALEDPDIRKQVLSMIDRDIEYGQMLGSPPREDLQNLRQIFGLGGWDAVYAAMGKGLLPAGAGAMLIPYLQDDKQGGGNAL